MIAEMVEDFNLVSFEVLSVENKQSMINLLSIIDKANGYSFGSSEVGGDTIWSEATRQGGMSEYLDIDIHERWIDHKEEYDEQERKEQEELRNSVIDQQQPKLTEDEEWEMALQDWENKRGGDALLPALKSSSPFVI
ncbi:hypothetical protein QCA50_017169 [Cerrena zonata]|uniref:GPN-loop GTPase 2 n=1 Tax=Cerrena zonata TaxID=2478898 RepID=A0AAW0FRD7_9APHY